MNRAWDVVSHALSIRLNISSHPFRYIEKGVNDMTNLDETYIFSISTLFYSGHKQLFYALLLLIILDMLTGILKAWRNRTLWSQRTMVGYSKKIGIICIVIVANIIDVIFNLEGIFINGSVLYYVFSESTSIIENCNELGIPIPDQIKARLKSASTFKKGDPL